MSPRPENSTATEDENLSNRFKFAHPPKGEEIVISGCSGSFPDSDGIYMFRDKLMNKIDLINDDDRRWKTGHPEIPQRTGKIYNVEKFDAGFFGVHSKQANVMDPIVRLSLERVYEAIVDAGVNPESLRGTNTGVFNGACFSESEKMWFYDNIENDSLGITSGSRAAASGRVAYWLGVNSVSYVTDTACSSSLTALERAYFALRQGHCEAAIVMGESLCLHPVLSLQFSRLGVLSADGRCKSFDNNANGYCRSEAIPAMFLQKEKDAKRVYAKIIHVKTNCDGFKEHGITFPGRHMQLKLLQDFYSECGVDPNSISYMEAHGTGTRIGDPEECYALDQIFCRKRNQPLLIGSVKSNMGHSEAASGLCSVAKALITFETGLIPPNLHYYSPREGIDGLIEGRMKVVTEPTPLPGNKGLIGINSFGFGGANAHTLLEWNHKSKVQGGVPSDNIPRLLAISGRHQEAISVVFDDVKSRPLDAEFVHLLNDLHSNKMAGLLARGFAIFTTTGEKLRIIQDRTLHNEFGNEITFVFPGLGEQTTGMGKSLMKLAPFASTIELLTKALSFTDIDLWSILTDNDTSLDNILNSTLALVACQIGLVDCLAAVGVYPSNVIGYSIGEIACAYAVRNLTAEQSIQTAYFMAKSMLEAEVSNTATIRVGIDINDIAKYQASGIEVSANNALNCLSLVGPVNAIHRMAEILKSKNIEVEDINLSGAGLHSHYVAIIEPKLLAFLKKVIPHPMPRSENWTSTSHRDVNNRYCSAEYFVQSIINPVNLKAALDKLEKGAIFLGMGRNNWLKEQLTEYSTQYIDVFDSQAQDASVQFLTSLGFLYLSEVNLTLPNLYPEIKYPVSRSTPMISPLVRWDHHRNWFVGKFDEVDTQSGAETIVKVSLKKDDYSFISGHMVDGRILFPATGYVNMVFNVLSNLTENMSNHGMVVFEDISFMRATPLTDDELEFIISLEKVTRHFEIMQGGALIVTGKVSCINDEQCDLQWADPSILVQKENVSTEKVILSKKDIYKELRLRGYNYTGLFRGLDAVDSTGGTGLVAWNDNWVSFMDTMLQIQIVNVPNRDLFVPTYIGKIIIDRSLQIKALQNLKNDESPQLPINYYSNVNVIKSGGVEIWNLNAQQIQRRKPMFDAVLEKYVFTPNNFVFESNEKDSLLKTTRILVHMALENLPGVKVKVLELADKALTDDSELMAPHVASVLADLPLIQADVRVVASPESYHGKNSNAISVDGNALQTEKDCSIIIGSDLLARKEVLDKLRGCVKENGFIISREKSKAAAVGADLSILAEYVVDFDNIILLRKSKPLFKDVQVIAVTSDDTFSWIEPLKEALASNAQQVIAVTENDRNSGILGLINCLRQEPSGEKLRCVFIRDQAAPRFDANLPFYTEQLSKNLIFNVYDNGAWGSYRHHLLPSVKTIPSQHVFISNRVKGDLSSLSFYQGHFSKQMALLNRKPYVKVVYAALNFRDVLTASGKIAVPSPRLGNNGIEIGFEFSGYNDKGERVMGFLPCGALTTTSDEVFPELTWKVPEGISLEEAATIPAVYLTAYRCLVTCGKCERGESILIHAGAGGVGIAAINISLALGLEIFVTVGSAEKRKFLHDNYPQIPDSHIGCSRDTTFEDMIKKETNNRGVDLVLNSLADEKMHASLRCLADKGRFLEIGKYDLLNNVSLDAEPFLKNISYHAIMLDVAVNGETHLKKNISDDMNCLINRNLIKPLPRTIFDFTEPEEALRYMATGKHIGKVLLKVCDEKKFASVPRLFNAIPRYFCNPSASYVILGGLGGFGLELSNWLVSRGARTLMLTSRTGVQNGYQSYRIAAWESAGTRVYVSTDDISTEAGVKKLLTDSNALAPVAGIFNLAVLLKDALFVNQTEETFRTSFKAKAKATVYLDVLSRTLCPNLEDFVVFSSVSCGRGNPGQSNYGMSNSIMERICENRKLEGLPGLAVQWGAVGEVGLVAEMAETNQQLVIGGTLQQAISSCLQCMDTFLAQDAPVVASMVVAEKRAGRKAGATMVETISSILGIKDLKTVSHNTTLSELGMDSMTVVEIKQMLEREFEVFVSAQDLRSLTFTKLAAMDLKASSGPVDSKRLGLNVLVRNIPLQSDAVKKVILLNDVTCKSAAPMFFVPGLDGLIDIFSSVVKDLKKQALALAYPYKNELNTSIGKTAELMLPAILELLSNGEDFKIVGYSAGALVAIELANHLEAAGRRGQLVLIDGSPALINGLLKAINIDATDENLENTVLEAVYDSVIADGDKTKFLELKTWNEKIAHLHQSLPNSFEHSVDYIRDGARELVLRLKNILAYKTSVTNPLKSKITLIKPEEETFTGMSDDHGLSTLTQEPVQVLVVKGDHATIWNNPQLATILGQVE